MAAAGMYAGLCSSLVRVVCGHQQQGIRARGLPARTPLKPSDCRIL